MDIKIVTVVLASILVLMMLVAYAVSLVEKYRDERNRLRVELTEKNRKVSMLNREFPAQFMTAELKRFLCRLEQNCMIRLIDLDKPPAGSCERNFEIERMIGNPKTYLDENKALPIASEPTARFVRDQIHALHAIMQGALNDGVITVAEAQRWLQFFVDTQVKIYLEMFGRISAREMADQAPAKAKITFERAIQFLSKQNTNGQYSAELEQLKVGLEFAGAESSKMAAELRHEDFFGLEQSVDKLLLEEEGLKKRAF
jgi:hypothetical protein